MGACMNIQLGNKNKYYTIYLKLREDISRGRIKAGEKLPSKRALAEELGVSVVTVQLAYEQLVAEGYIRSKERSGYFAESVPISPAPPLKSAKKEEEKENSPAYMLDLVKGSAPAELFPFSVWAKLMRRVLSDCGEHLLERVPAGGDRELKEAVSGYLYRARGIDADPENIVIGAGAEYLYGIIVQLLGRDCTFAVENPGYGKIAQTYALNGAKVVPVPVKEAGICPDEEALRSVAALHISPSHQFPTGTVIPAKNRAKLVNWATDAGAYVIEDDYDSEFRLSGKPLQSMYSLAPEKVIYMNTFSKSLAPSMRMGYMVLPAALMQRFKEVFGGTANVVPLFEQKTLALMLDGGYFERHLSRLKNHYKGVHSAILTALSLFGGDCEVKDTGSGLHLIAKFPRAQSDGEIKQKALSAGVRVKCLSDYHISPLDGTEKCAVINFSGVTEEQVRKAAALIKYL